jgi:hypothetical protein
MASAGVAAASPRLSNGPTSSSAWWARSARSPRSSSPSGSAFTRCASFREEAERREVEQREREAEKRREQAEQISAIARVGNRPEPLYDLDRPGNIRGYFGYADIINASNLPIYEAKVAVPSDEGTATVIRVGFVPPGENGHAHLPPLDDRALHGQHVVVAFRDAAGRWWRRCEGGHIHQHDEDPFPRPQQSG